MTTATKRLVKCTPVSAHRGAVPVMYGMNDLETGEQGYAVFAEVAMRA
jgi:hypothetical protein